MIDQLQIQKWIEERIQVLESRIESINLLGPALSDLFEAYCRGKIDAIRNEIGHLKELIREIS